ncbi:putative patatin/cPLA2 family phospholipase [Trueperella bonasi]|uniref:Patatin/cPLA2 family phospholipase n=1 Tax=Trueperella bonasi TaxID=312286 RepID=A0ABT9NGQ3_9ACTO|nr:patatin family protein [Trueperella bonasi]MDP9806576.1 putative patatin/cPLA2 family phospholipase [Trueperella bonasi]
MIEDTALVLEGGGMRASYTAPVVQTLLDLGVNFPLVAGISAGATHAANFLSRERERARSGFVEFAGDPKFGNLRSFAEGKGLFNARYIYEEATVDDGPLPYNFQTYRTNPADVRIGSFNSVTGSTQYWTKAELDEPDKLMRAVRASSTMPVIMPPIEIRGELHVDGALGSSGGIPLDAAEEAGCERYIVVLTRSRDYVKRPPRNPRILERLLPDLPLVAQAANDRWRNYNTARERIRELESAGKAWVFWPRHMMVSNQERNVSRLRRNYNRGRLQILEQLPSLRDFLGI